MPTPSERLINTIPYTSGTTVRVYSPDIPRSLWAGWSLLLAGTLSKTEVGAGTLAENCLALVKGFRVLLDGDVIKDIDLTHLRVLAHHVFRGLDTDITDVTLGTDVAEAFAGRVALDFRIPRSEMPNLGFLPAARYKQLAVEVDWGASTDLVSGGTYTGVSFPTAPTLQIYGRDVVEMAERMAKKLIHKYSQKQFGVNAAAETAKVCSLPYGEVYRGILISQYTNSPRLPISTLVTATGNIVVRVVGAGGTRRVVETTWSELTKKNKADYGIAMPTGYAFIDFQSNDDGGKFSDCLRTDKGSGVQAVEVLVDVASVANAFLQFTSVTYKPALKGAEI